MLPGDSVTISFPSKKKKMKKKRPCGRTRGVYHPSHLGHRAVAWKLLHGSLFVGVFTAYIHFFFFFFFFEGNEMVTLSPGNT